MRYRFVKYITVWVFLLPLLFVLGYYIDVPYVYCNSGAALFAQDKNKLRTYDRDGDGIWDDEDACPDMPGPSRTKGCPDSDNDGVADYEDECPNQPGLIIFLGCPDSDGDGIPDKKDVCPDQPGPPENGGCPVQKPLPTIQTTEPDVEDDVLKEPEVDYQSMPKPFTVAPPAIGTPQKIHEASPTEFVIKDPKITDPEIIREPKINVYNKDLKVKMTDIHNLTEIIKSINFENGRIIFTSVSYKGLEQLATILKQYPNWNVVFHCYTSEGESYFRNQQLANNRGAVIKQNLVRKQIDGTRIEYKGYGSAEGASYIDVDIK